MPGAAQRGRIWTCRHREGAEGSGCPLPLLFNTLSAYKVHYGSTRGWLPGVS
jgi:hypothetical protein